MMIMTEMKENDELMVVTEMEKNGDDDDNNGSNLLTFSSLIGTMMMVNEMTVQNVTPKEVRFICFDMKGD